MNNRKAAYKLYAQAIPGSFAIEKRTTAPCKATCPAHVSIQGYIALMNQGKYAEALKLFKEEHPFPGICGRVCHHPCEGICTRDDVDQPMSIRGLHRFLADIDRKSPYVPETAGPRDEKIAVVGAGPSGLTAAYNLALKGYPVTVYDKLPVAGGMMAVGIPEYRLPRDVLAEEIKVIQEMGVEIVTGVEFGKDVTLDGLKQDGYKAVFLGIGLHNGRKLGVPNEDSEGVLQGVDFLRDVSLGNSVNIGESVLVVGGGNVAVDVALTARRKGARKVTLVCLEARDEMPAWEHEIQEALEAGIEIANSLGPKSFLVDEDNKAKGIEFKSCTAVFDSENRFNPQYDENVCQSFLVDTVIVSIGQSADLSFASDQNIPVTPRGGIDADMVTRQTSVPWVFAGGDVHHGPKSVVEAVASGKEAAESIDRFINGRDLMEGRPKEWLYEKPDISGEPLKERIAQKGLAPEVRDGNFDEIWNGYTEEEARQEAARCLKCGICSECNQCVDACLAGAINHNDRTSELDLKVGSVVLAPGSEPYDPSHLRQFYQYGENPNVLTSLEFERILSASGPTVGHMERPSDHKEPEKIAWLQCVGSRDQNQCANGYCSSVCCMYAVKDAMIAKEHSKQSLDTAIFYMDMRTFGKDYEKYLNRARDKDGVRFVKARVHTVDSVPKTGDLEIRYADEAGNIRKETFDMVVLSVGLQIQESTAELARRLEVRTDQYRFAETEPFTPVETSRPGVYACGVFQGPKDIPTSVTQASAAACAAGLGLAGSRNTDTRPVEIVDERSVLGEESRIGVFICKCGINIAGVVDVPAVEEYAGGLPGVVYTGNNLFTCSQDTQERIKEVIEEQGLNRVVVASCTPKTHENIFMETLVEAGLNRYLFEMANIRNQDSWVHSKEPETATAKAKELVRAAVARVATLRPLNRKKIPVTPRALVIGGGVAGMTAASSLADQGFETVIVEKEREFGGFARKLHHTIEGSDIRVFVKDLVTRVESNRKVTVLKDAVITGFKGYKGNFETTVAVGEDKRQETIDHGIIVVATGASEYRPTEYLYGQNDKVMTQVELSDRLENKGTDDLSTVVMIQCVGSRNEQNPNCSRVCCQAAVKNALSIKKKNPDALVFVLHKDIRTYGLMELYYKEARNLGVVFIRFNDDKPPEVSVSGDRLFVTVYDTLLDRNLEIETDLLALSAATQATDTEELSDIMKLNRNSEGFFMEAHVKLRPVDMASDGLFLCGTAHGPKLISETIAQAEAAASRAVTLLSKDELTLSAITAHVDVENCIRCLTCVRSCPFQVPMFNEEEGVVEIDEAICHGCGICTAVCPRQAILLNSYENDQLNSKIDALLMEI